MSFDEMIDYFEEAREIIRQQDLSDKTIKYLIDIVDKDIEIASKKFEKLEKALELYQKALELYGKQVYEKDDYTCNGYCCVVATTHYEPDEEKKICSRCLGDRLLDQARKEIENGK